ncbi:hypothetical protein [Virgisporangium ochraceum]|uniref:Uncharacterized protein n=1 Tax=Virgisporangium ochraceum TaxID=65505 RepID=A0A8J3ZME0_9ACTN|nr:hypothetical protein [Virgisporangium ochraceum]GIJ66707.1 hypothetical protein Voc01_016240 [Virgisporangium ochraceum]
MVHADTLPQVSQLSTLAGAVRALEVHGDLAASRVRFDAAFRAADADGDAERTGLAALGFGGMWVHEQRSATAAALVESRLRYALSVVDPASTLALRLRVRLAAETDYRAGTSDDVLGRLDEARAAGDPVALAEALSLAHHCLLGPEHGERRLALSRDLIAQSLVTKRRSDQLTGLLWHAVDLLLTAHPHAERALADLQAELARAEHLAIRFVERAVTVMLRLREGAFAEAEALAVACAEQGHRAGDVDVTGWYGAHLIALRWFQGRSAELIPMLTHQVHSPTFSAVDNSHLAALAAVCALSGDRRQATGALARLVGDDLGALPRSSSWLVTMYGAVEAAAALDDAGTAASAYRLLAPFAHLPMVASLGVTCFGSTRHALGVAALTTGDLDVAVRHLRAAVRDNWALGHFPAVALSRSRLAQALARRSGPGDAAEARRELGTARQEASDLGMALPDAVPAATHPAAAQPPARAVTCRRHGGRWRIELGRRAAVVPDSVGMAYLAVLIANPGAEIPAVELAVGRAALDRVAGGVTAEQAAASAQPVLDEVARRAYQRRLAHLQAEIDALEQANDLLRAERLRDERAWLLDELAASTGLRGRTREFAGGTERARVSVGKAIRRALDRVGRCDPVIAEELRSHVTTGVRCSYRPA